MVRWSKTWALVLAILLAGAARGQSGEPTSQIRAAMHNLAPYAFEKEGRIVGVLPDVYAELAQRTGLEFTYRFVPTKRMVHLLKGGEIDLAIYFASPALDPYVIRLVRFSEIVNIVVGLKGVDIHSREDLARLRVGVLRGGHFEKDFVDNPDWDHVPTVDYVQSVKLLSSGRVDALVGTAEGLFYNMERAGVGAEDLGKVFVYSRGTSWAQLSKAAGPVAEAEQMRAALEAMIAGCFNTRARARYLGADMMMLLKELQQKTPEGCEAVLPGD